MHTLAWFRLTQILVQSAPNAKNGLGYDFPFLILLILIHKVCINKLTCCVARFELNSIYIYNHKMFLKYEILIFPIMNKILPALEHNFKYRLIEFFIIIYEKSTILMSRKNL